MSKSNCINSCVIEILSDGKKTNGFTLIELSIVLVIIGLVTGGIIVGLDMVNIASSRATISQLEKYRTAISTFRIKYNNQYPGDISNPDAGNFGFSPRGSMPGQGDGNGLLEVYSTASCHYGPGTTNDSCAWGQGVGEIGMFWVDLSKAQLINENFSTADPVNFPPSAVTGSGLDKYLPQAKLGRGNYFEVSSTMSSEGNISSYSNVFVIQGMLDIDKVSGCPICQEAVAAMTVAQAYYIDSKIDDGLPQTGKVLAGLSSSGGNNGWAAGGGLGQSGTSDQSSTPGSATTCFDNNATNNATQHYSMEINSGSNLNCGLIIGF